MSFSRRLLIKVLLPRLNSPTTATTNGLHTTTASTTPVRNSFSGIQKPAQPTSNVKPVEINIPDFLKNSRK